MTFLLLTAVAITIGVAIVVVRNRPNTSMESSIDHFQRGLRALAPESDADRPQERPVLRPEPIGEPVRVHGDEALHVTADPVYGDGAHGAYGDGAYGEEGD